MPGKASPKEADWCHFAGQTSGRSPGKGTHLFSPSIIRCVPFPFPITLKGRTAAPRSSSPATRRRNFGFRVQDQRTGKYRSNIVWLNRSYGGRIGEPWLREAVELSNGQEASAEPGRLPANPKKDPQPLRQSTFSRGVNLRIV